MLSMLLHICMFSIYADDSAIASLYTKECVDSALPEEELLMGRITIGMKMLSPEENVA